VPILRYISTRGEAPTLGFEEVLLTGLARDGGLYIPDVWPQFDAASLRALRGLSFAQAAGQVIQPFVGDCFTRRELDDLLARSYETFRHRAVTPLVQLDHRLWLMELFHGPTLAFKDVALQFLGQLFDAVLQRRGEAITVIGATSGDTGSAAIEACKDREAVDIFILHPFNRVSPVQRRQMTTVLAPNVHNIAIEGTFDDCQELVKAMFDDAAFRDDLRLSAVNSINWARIMAQIVYYVTAAVALGAPDRRVAFAVPTGNFGNVYAAYAARAMGVPIDHLVIGTNTNDILTRCFQTGRLERSEVVPTLSPSMDIQISSNFERYLFDLCGRDGAALRAEMQTFRETGQISLTPAQWHQARTELCAYRLDDGETTAVIRDIYEETGLVIDPHTAVGVGAARAAIQADRVDRETAMVALACAHPAKFPQAVAAAVGYEPGLPPALADLHQRPERVTVLRKDLTAVQTYIRNNARATFG